MIKLNKHGLISNRLIAPEFTVGNTFVEGGGTPEELSVLSLTKEQLEALSYIVNGEGRIIPVGEDGTFDTKIGHSYCIRHTDDLTLHEAWLSNNENLYVKRYGSGQLLFFATSEKCKINDPSYIVTEVFRMAALNDFVDWSGIEHYQKWFREVEVELTELLGSRDKFVLEIADENTLVVHTDRVSDELMEAVTALLGRMLPDDVKLAQYNHTFEISWREINKYAKCTSAADMLAVNPDYVNDLTSDAEWIYPLPGMVDEKTNLFKSSPMKSFSGALPNLKISGQGYGTGWFDGVKTLNDFRSELPSLTGGYNMFKSTKIDHWDIELPHLTNGWHMFRNGALKEWHIELPELIQGEAMFECPNLTVFTVELPKLQYAMGMFSKAQLNKESALRVLTSIPAYTSGNRDMGMGIHVDHQQDEEVLEAIANAEAKGWSLTVQWNGTSTSTASTMAMGSLIYAKVVEHELPDSTTEKFLDWGHYVTDETGYETFRSLESAYEYFGLKNSEIE